MAISCFEEDPKDQEGTNMCKSINMTNLGKDYLSTNNLVFINNDEGWMTAKTKDDITNNRTHLLHTTDGGKTWESLTTLSSIFYHSVDFLDSNIGYYIGGMARNLYKTLDGGKTWSIIIDKQVTAFAYNSTQTVALFSATGIPATLAYIENDGNSVAFETALPEDDMFNTMVMHLSESGDINFGSIRRVKSKDEFGNKEYYKYLDLATLSNGVWSYTALSEKSEQMLVSAKSMFFVNDSVGYYLNPKNSYGDEKGALYRTEDGGQTWDMVYDFNKPENEVQLSYIAFADENTGYGSSNIAFSSLYKTTDGGKTWNKVYNDESLLLPPESLSFPSLDNLYFTVSAQSCDEDGPKIIRIP
jgi:photosystem II stability/assembly factor-like uncharacterized protein